MVVLKNSYCVRKHKPTCSIKSPPPTVLDRYAFGPCSSKVSSLPASLPCYLHSLRVYYLAPGIPLSYGAVSIHHTPPSKTSILSRHVPQAKQVLISLSQTHIPMMLNNVIIAFFIWIMRTLKGQGTLCKMTKGLMKGPFNC